MITIQTSKLGLQWVFVCARAIQIFATPTVAPIQEWCLFRSARVEVQLLFERGY